MPEKVNQLVAERNRKVEDRFGVKIVTVDQMGAWGKHEDFMSYIRNSMVQEDPGYDIIAGYAAIMPSFLEARPAERPARDFTKASSNTTRTA